MRGRHSEKSFPCFASKGQKQGKTELFMVADLREMQENQRVSEIRIDKSEFVEEFFAFLKAHKEYDIIVAEENGIVVSAMFVYLIPKLPKPNGNAKFIAYLTNVYTKKEYRNKGIGTQIMNYIKSIMIEKKCELLFAWPSDNSIAWYQRNGFSEDNEIFECPLCEE